MDTADAAARAYVLGSREQELARLDAQARTIEPATRLLLRASGIASGARVLDLGTGLVRDAFAAAGASPMIGARLGIILEDAGLVDVTTFGVQGYLPPHSPVGPAMLAGVVRSLAEAIVAHRIATREQIGLDTLEQRIASALADAQSVLLPPTVAGAWGTKPR